MASNLQTETIGTHQKNKQTETTKQRSSNRNARNLLHGEALIRVEGGPQQQGIHQTEDQEAPHVADAIGFSRWGNLKSGVRNRGWANNGRGDGGDGKKLVVSSLLVSFETKLEGTFKKHPNGVRQSKAGFNTSTNRMYMWGSKGIAVDWALSGSPTAIIDAVLRAKCVSSPMALGAI